MPARSPLVQRLPASNSLPAASASPVRALPLSGSTPLLSGRDATPNGLRTSTPTHKAEEALSPYAQQLLSEERHRSAVLAEQLVIERQRAAALQEQVQSLESALARLTATTGAPMPPPSSLASATATTVSAAQTSVQVPTGPQPTQPAAAEPIASEMAAAEAPAAEAQAAAEAPAAADAPAAAEAPEEEDSMAPLLIRPPKRKESLSTKVAGASAEWSKDEMQMLEAALSPGAKGVGRGNSPHSFRQRRLSMSTEDIPTVDAEEAQAQPPASASAAASPSTSREQLAPRAHVRRRRSSRMSITLADEFQRSAMEDAADVALDPRIAGTYSCHGAEPGKDGAESKINQDCASICYPVPGQEGGTGHGVLLCVLDGHGVRGSNVSQEAMHSLHALLDTALAPGSALAPAAAMVSAFEETQEHLARLTLQASETPKPGDAQPAAPETSAPAAADEKLETVDASASGACAVVAFLDEQTLTVAGAGDCRAVLGVAIAEEEERSAEGSAEGSGSASGVANGGGAEGGAAFRALDLSLDHKPDLPAEQARIEAAGGYVRPQTGEENDDNFAPARVYRKKDNPRLGPGLCVSRSLGDLDGVPCGMLATPHTTTHEVGHADRFLILASDGVWEFITSEMAVKIVGAAYEIGKPACDACRDLIVRAALLWKAHEGDYRDDITCVVVYLTELTKKLDVARAGAGS